MNHNNGDYWTSGRVTSHELSDSFWLGLPVLVSLCYCEIWRCLMADNVGSKVSFFLVGLGIGALVGILFAPKSGEETREYLTQKADEGREYAQRKARELRERAEDLVERGKSAAS